MKRLGWMVSGTLFTFSGVMHLFNALRGVPYPGTAMRMVAVFSGVCALLLGRYLFLRGLKESGH